RPSSFSTRCARASASRGLRTAEATRPPAGPSAGSVSWRRVLRILLFDLRHGALRPRGLLFVVPFLLLWYPILRGFDPDVAAWFRGRDALVLTATLFDAAVARSLFLEHPPLLSACFLVALS